MIDPTLLKQLFESGGVSLVILFVICLGLWRGVWPYLTRKIDQLLDNYQQQGEKFIKAIDAQRDVHLLAMDRQENKFIAELQHQRSDAISALNQQSSNFGDGQNKLGEAMNKQSDMLQQVINMVQELVQDRRKVDSPRAPQERRGTAHEKTG